MEFTNQTRAVLENLPALSPNGVGISSSSKPFIEANTVQMSASEMGEHHIPVWVTTNEPLISHLDFIETVWEVVHRLFPQQTILKPNIRVSHPVKGRIPEAKHKSAKELMPWEETIYYERMMFIVELPGITENVNGNPLSLTIGGVKSYGLDNLYTKRTHNDQSFQLFVGFQNKVCCNLCVRTDGVKLEVGIKNLKQLSYSAEDLIGKFEAEKHLAAMRQFTSVEITESEFAHVVGRARMYKHLPDKYRDGIPEIMLGDQQLGTVVRSYYKDKNFGNEAGGDISLWDFYNLLTGANKSTYIDAFVDRSVNAHDFTDGVLKHKISEEEFWYLR